MYHYDELPYESLPFAETHPHRLSLLARLFGIRAAHAQACRVLEIGSAAGGNLIPMAWYLPQSEFVGIDLEASQVREGQRIIDELGMRNVQLRQGDVLHLGDELGDFDYIIAHGVYSWVPEPVREALFRVCRQRLRPNGIAYISYNTLPGWRMRGMLREMLLFHVRHISAPLEALAAARKFIDLLSSALPRQNSPLARYLLDEAKYLQHAHPNYLYHEFLEENNTPVLFTDFAAQAQRHDLRYLCESHLNTMFASALGADVEAFLDSYPDMLVHEQYLDFLYQRTFRQSLICHIEQEPDYDIDLAMLDEFACYAQLDVPTRLDLRPARAQPFTSPAGKQFFVSDPLLKQMLKHVCEHFPDAIALSDLLAQAHQALPASDATDGAAWRGELFNLFINQAVRLVLDPVRLETAGADRPQVNDLVRVQAREGNNLTTVWHEIVYTDAFSRQLVAYLDGTHDQKSLRELLLRDIESGRLGLDEMKQKGQKAVRTGEEVAANIRRLLALFARNGLLVNRDSKGT